MKNQKSIDVRYYLPTVGCKLTVDAVFFTDSQRLEVPIAQDEDED